MQKLSTLKKGQRGRIVSLADDEPVLQRLMTLGLMPGVEVRVVNIAPLGDPIAVIFGQQRMSLRRKEAGKIFLEAA